MNRVPAGPAGPADRPSGTSNPASEPLLGARDRHGQTPEEWLSRALAGADGAVLDIRCGSEDRIELRRLVDIPTGPVIPTGSVVACADRLPLRTNALAGVRATMCLPSVTALDGLFAELRRVLRPTGTIAAMVPARPVGSLTEMRVWWPLRRALAGRQFRHKSARTHPEWLFAAADFAVLGDQRRTFWLPVPDGESAAALVDGLVPAGLWPAGVLPEQLAEARLAMARYAAPGRAVPIPLRLLVARR